jgi:hypothetical protein
MWCGQSRFKKNNLMVRDILRAEELSLRITSTNDYRARTNGDAAAANAASMAAVTANMLPLLVKIISFSSDQQFAAANSRNRAHQKSYMVQQNTEVERIFWPLLLFRGLSCQSSACL